MLTQHVHFSLLQKSLRTKPTKIKHCHHGGCVHRPAASTRQYQTPLSPISASNSIDVPPPDVVFMGPLPHCIPSSGAALFVGRWLVASAERVGDGWYHPLHATADASLAASRPTDVPPPDDVFILEPSPCCVPPFSTRHPCAGFGLWLSILHQHWTHHQTWHPLDEATAILFCRVRTEVSWEWRISRVQFITYFWLIYY